MMKILVIEDNPEHRQSAVETLAGHEVTIVESYDKAVELMKSTNPLPFEVVLTDMMMPMSSKGLAPGVFNPDEQVPYGFVIALMATLCGAKYVAMVTDTNHHEGAMSKAIDHLGSAYYRDEFTPNFIVNGASVMFVHTPFVEVVVPESCYSCDGTGERKSNENTRKCSSCDGTGDGTRCGGKNWGKVLHDLTRS